MWVARTRWRHMAVLAAVLFGAPVLTAGAAVPATPSAGSPSASLTITRTTPGFGGPPGSFFVEILAKGALPAKMSFPLVNAAGLNEVIATADPKGCARHPNVRATTLGTTPWCLRVGVPRAGSVVTGTVSSADASVVLTVASRRDLLGWPLVVALAGLATALFVVFLSPSYFGTVPRRLRMRAALSTREVEGLDYEWVKAHLGGRSSGDPAVVSPVIDAAEHGCARADAARRALGNTVSDVERAHLDWALLAPARKELARAAPAALPAPGIAPPSATVSRLAFSPAVKSLSGGGGKSGSSAPAPYVVGDFLDDKIVPVVHPALQLAALLKDALSCRQALDQDEALLKDLGSDAASALGLRLGQVRDQLAAAATADDLLRVHRLIERLELAIMTPLPAVPPERSTPATEPADLADQVVPVGEPTAQERPRLQRARYLPVGTPLVTFAPPGAMSSIAWPGRLSSPSPTRLAQLTPELGPDLLGPLALESLMAVPGAGLVAYATSAVMAVRPRTWWRLASLLSVLVSSVLPMAVATGSVLSAVYFPSTTFGNTADYLSLFFAASGTASAAGIVSAIILARRSAVKVGPS